MMENGVEGVAPGTAMEAKMVEIPQFMKKWGRERVLVFNSHSDKQIDEWVGLTAFR